MPLGAKTAARDRPVIVVASEPGLVRVEEALLQAAGDSMDFATAAVVAGGLLAGGWGLWKARKKQTQRREAACGDADKMASIRRLLDLGVPVAQFEPDQALDAFQFGVGNRPRDGSIWVQHPIFQDRYFAPEDFAVVVAREREAALRQLAAALGVKELWLTDAKVKTKKGTFSSTVAVPEAATQVGIKASFDSEGKVSRAVYSRYGRPTKPPTIPPDLQPWVDGDPELRTMARGRIESRLLEQMVTIEFKQSTGVGGEVAAKVAGKGITAGGTYQEMLHSIWTFRAEYWPRRDN